jgi:hypothetical protein
LTWRVVGIKFPAAVQDGSAYTTNDAKMALFAGVHQGCHVKVISTVIVCIFLNEEANHLLIASSTSLDQGCLLQQTYLSINERFVFWLFPKFIPLSTSMMKDDPS